MKSSDIRMRDPYVLARPAEGKMYLFGTTDPDPWRGLGLGFDAYVGDDGENWEGPYPAFRPPEGFWADRNFWAPEAHEYRGAFYLFASFKAEGHRRATQILRSDRPLGPYTPHSEGPVTPPDWECLDGTLYVDEKGWPWLVFCHEWVQTIDGEIHALRLSEDLKKTIGDPKLLFKASEAPWTRAIKRRDGSLNPAMRVTDGPFVYRCVDKTLLLLWSSFSDTGYALGAARSRSGDIFGPWDQEATPILDSDGGHGMLYTDFSGRLWLSYHSPNATPEERVRRLQLVESSGSLRLKKGESV